ncbi:long-chain fatty acid--CoA ligase [Anaerolineales bacterium]
MTSYADRPWLKSYDKGVPTSLTIPNKPLASMLTETAKRVPDAIALVTSAKVPVAGRLSSNMTYKELDDASDALASALKELEVKKGDRVAIVMPNSVAFVISFWAILKVGAVVAATNPTYPPDKLAYQINDCDAEVVLCLSMFYKLVKSVQSKTKVKTVIVSKYKEYLPPVAKLLFTLTKEKKSDHYLETLESGDLWFQDLLSNHAGKKANVEVSADDLALFQYTGGTTGVSKAAMSLHKTLVANMLQINGFLQVDKVPGEKEIFLGAIPMFHVYGLVVVVSLAAYLGARILLAPNARDTNDVLDIIDTFKPTLYPGVPALYNAINNHPDVISGKIDLRSLRVCISGSAPLPSTTKQEFERLSGAIVCEGFGMSEAPTATHVNPIRGENRVGSIGVPLPEMDMRIVSLDDGETDMPIGEVGELLMAGPNIMQGYHGMPTETENAIRVKDGKRWLYTGDIARMDEDGYFYIVDRKKDMALIGGFNVYPNAVENVLKAHPAILEVGVASVPHPEKEGQETLKAWVVLKPNMTVTAEEPIKHCEGSLAPYEIPRRFAFIDELPKSTVGKTLRRELIRLEAESN